MIPSKYNFILRNDENAILYNAFSDEMVVMHLAVMGIPKNDKCANVDCTNGTCTNSQCANSSCTNAGCINLGC